MIVIGITGGIGSGKSTVTDYLKTQGYKVIDADLISHQITEGTSETVEKIGQTFGKSVIRPDGTLDRKALAAIVFNDDSQKVKLEAIVTDKVNSLVAEKVKEYRQEGREKMIFIDAPLLIESGTYKLTDYIWLVVCDMKVRVERVMARDHATEAQVEARINNQMSDEEKKALASDIIDNSNGKEQLYEQIKLLLEKYAQL